MKRIIERIRQLYKCREGRLVPFPWCDEFTFNLDDIFTRLKIVNKEKTRGTLTDDEITNMTAIFRPHPDCQKPRVLLVEGEPGMGKTTYSQKLAYDWATEQDEWDASFPSIEVLLLLRCNDVESGIWEAIDNQLLPDDIDEQAKDNFFKYIQENQANVLLLLDGLDEANSCKLDMYLSLVQGKLLSSCHMVITSRHEVGKKVRPYCDTLWEIVGFTKDDAKGFIRKYFQGKEHLAEEMIEKYDGPFKNESELTKNPLNTALLCCLFEDSAGVFPASRTQLYVEIVILVLRRYEDKNRIASSSEDLTSVYREELLLLGIHALKSLLNGEMHFEEKGHIVKSINLGLLSLQQGGSKSKPFTRCAFLHKSFQEFFAGFYLAFQIINKEIDCASIVGDVRYFQELQGVFLFMSGILALQSQDTAESLVLSITRHVNVALQSDEPFRQIIYMRLAFEFLSECLKLDESLATRLASTLGTHLDMSSVTKARLAYIGLRDTGAAAISQMLRANSSLTDMDLSMNSIGDSGASSISQALTGNSSLAVLYLSINSIGDAGASCISQALTINTSLAYLDLSKNLLGPAGASCLFWALKVNCSLNVLNLHQNNIGDVGASSLSLALRANSSLTVLHLGRNNIGTVGASCLSQALTINFTLATLDLSDNNVGDDGASSLAQALSGNSSLTYLSLGGNNIGLTGASSLSQALTINSSLTSLDLASNSIDDVGACYIAQALSANSTLTSLWLERNSIGDAGASFLSQALTENSTLTTLFLRNNMIGYAGASSLSQALTKNSSLTDLILK